ncbi:hypothetical protein POVCU1_044330 [Plasmodium ovale curtisi]|uniref:Uncharacterized protein n=1 Tax=Plasmodium ovale curtisi TaxID=864141 RepID=A0A1A8X217_PLAOA|nr:hypothetical protein POVCU1_044330 [Plasmodium ovale curtisi]
MKITNRLCKQSVRSNNFEKNEHELMRTNRRVKTSVHKRVRIINTDRRVRINKYGQTRANRRERTEESEQKRANRRERTDEYDEIGSNTNKHERPQCDAVQYINFDEKMLIHKNLYNKKMQQKDATEGCNKKMQQKDATEGCNRRMQQKDATEGCNKMDEQNGRTKRNYFFYIKKKLYFFMHYYFISIVNKKRQNFHHL